MIRPEFILTTVVILTAILLLRPRSRPVRFYMRIATLLLTIFMWGYITADFVLWWGYTGNFPVGFGIFCLPLCVALFPTRPWRNALLFMVLYAAFTFAHIMQVAYPNISLTQLIQDIPSWLFLGLTVAIMGLPGVFLVWLIQGGSRSIDQWFETGKAQRKLQK
jgi:hypothetical protein